MKKIIAMAAAAALVCGAASFAANPFSDVSPDDWAYQAVSDLSDQGIVEGYPDGTFRGERNITRYELAQIIARLMANGDQYNAEQRATIDKLASEYADELNNLGVRVSNLEKKVGNIYWSGDARMRYQSRNNTYTRSGEASDGWNGRIRLNAHAQVNESTYVQGRIVGNMNFRTTAQNQDNGDVYMDRLYVHHQFGDFNIHLGRFPVLFGDQTSWLYGSARGLDGAQLGFASGNSKWTAVVGYGRFNASDSDNGYREVYLTQAGEQRNVKNIDAFYSQAAYNWNPYSNFNANYIHLTGRSHFGGYGSQDNGDIWGLGTTIAFGNDYNWRIFGEYWNNSTADKYDNAWNVGLGYGHLNKKKPGSFDLEGAYNKVDRNVYFGCSGEQVDQLKTLDSFHQGRSVKYWFASGDVTIMPNVYVHGEYAFDVNSQHSILPDHDSWTLSLNYVF